MAMQSRFGAVPTAQATDTEGSRELASDILKSVRQLSYVSRERGPETLVERIDFSFGGCFGELNFLFCGGASPSQRGLGIAQIFA